MDAPWGVGVIGVGPGVSVLHLPTLARLEESFRVVRIADGGSGRAAGLAARTGATASSRAADVVADPAVDVVAICSPPELHAEQVVAAAQAGKRAILCEKPLGLTHDEIGRAVEACRSAGSALVVGTNHLHDPAWGRAKHHLLQRRWQARAISITIALPPNERYHAAVTDDVPVGSTSARSAPDWENTEVAAAIVRQLILGLAIHDLPLVRDLAPDLERVVFARPAAPIGYSVGLVASGVPVSLTAVMLPAGADALWRMRILTDGDDIDIDFPPSFVHRGSAVVTVHDADGRLIGYPADPDDGYVAEWRALAALSDGEQTMEYDEVAADAHFAVALADAAADWIRAGGAS